MRLIYNHPKSADWFENRNYRIVSESHYPPTEHDSNAYWVYEVEFKLKD